MAISRLSLGSPRLTLAHSRLTLAISRAGELNFLRVSPFGAGHEDGFWHHVIAGPWERRDDAALDALQVLLRALMLRRSKSQTTLDGVPILSLPPRTLRREPIKLEGSELASCAPPRPEAAPRASCCERRLFTPPAANRYALLEQLIAAEILRTGALADQLPDGDPQQGARSRGQQSARGRLLVSGLRLLREGAVAMQLLSGGAGCTEQLKAIDEIARAQLQHAARSAVAPDGAALLSFSLRQLSPAEAISRNLPLALPLSPSCSPASFPSLPLFPSCSPAISR